MQKAVLRLQGGLGNQMFIYAFGKALELQGFRVSYHIPQWYATAPEKCMNQNQHLLIKDTDNGAVKQVELLDFDVQMEIEKDFNPQKFLVSLEKHPLVFWFWFVYAKLFRVHRIYTFKRIMPKARWENPFSPFCFQDPESEYVLFEQFKKLPGAYFLGCWQDLYYFKSVESIIKKEFQLKRSLNLKNQETVNFIKSTKNNAFLHIRRGDYLNCDMFTNLDSTYYESAICYLKERLEDLHLFVFSNDIKWAKNEFLNTLSAECKKGVTFYFVDNNSADFKSLQAIEEMQLMRECQNAIIANSTFSWWAAYLMDNPQKIAIIPTNWMTTERLKRFPTQLIFDKAVLMNYKSGKVEN